MGSKIAFLFPGQGSQKVGMAADFVANLSPAKEKFEQASKILGFDLMELCLSGPEEKLRQTESAQVALFVLGAVVADEMMNRGLKPICAAGHSLGEYTALYTAGAFNFEDGVRLVRFRGEQMAAAEKQNPGTMAAIIGLPWQQVAQCCSQVKDNIVVPANHNTLFQTVISGEIASVKEAGERAKELGAKVIPLNVSGAFHSPLMEPARAALKNFLSLMVFSPLKIDLVSNVTGKKVVSAEEEKELLPQQLVKPVLWFDCMKTITEAVDSGFELGAGNVLTGLAKKNFPGFICTPVDDFSKLKKIKP